MFERRLLPDFSDLLFVTWPDHKHRALRRGQHREAADQLQLPQLGRKLPMNAGICSSPTLQLWQKRLEKPLCVETTSPPLPTGPRRWHKASFPDFSRAGGRGATAGRGLRPGAGCHPQDPCKDLIRPRWRCQFPRFTDEAWGSKVAGLRCAAQPKASNFFQGNDPRPGPQRRGSISQSEAGGTPELRGIPQGPASPPEGPPALSFSPFLLQLARVDNRP